MNIPNITVLEAPAGYGKTFHIEKQVKALNLKALKYDYQENDYQSFIKNLKELCSNNSIPVSESDTPFEWHKAWKSTEPFILIFDDFHLLNFDKKVNEFLSYFFKNILVNIYIFIASRCKTDLPVHIISTSDVGSYLDKYKLNLAEWECKKLWHEHNLSWNTDDQSFFKLCQGWPISVKLYLKYKQGTLSKPAFKNILHDAVSDAFSPFKQNVDFFSHENFKELKKWFLESESWPTLWDDTLFSKSQNNPEYWLHKSIQDNVIPQSGLLYLNRALNLAIEKESPELQLKILTRIAHTHTLTGNYPEEDLVLSQAEVFLKNGKVVDNLAWNYLKANRLRQLCKHNEAVELLEKIVTYKCTDKISLNFQTRARVVLGLTAYQQGNYEFTRKCYSDALILADADRNTALSLEITIMLAFLDVWEGKSSDSLPENIVDLIEKQHLKSQPMMWLNLIFYWTFGEKLDLKLDMLILQKIKELSKQLQWDFLNPLIADIEARLWRYHKEYEKAHTCHKLVLSNIEKDTFEYLHANLNLGLTFLRQGNKEKADEILLGTLEQARKAGALGLVREIEILLQTGEPENKISQNIQIVKKEFDLPILTIRMFAGFEIQLGDKVITKWPRKKAKQLLVYLLLNQRGIHRETLADMLFMDSMDQPLKNLDVNIHSLRKLLEPTRKSKESSFILFQNSCYTFNWEYPHIFDVNEFESLYKEWQKLHSNFNDETENLAKDTIHEYTGIFLPEIDFADDWVSEREAYQKNAIDISSWLVKNQLAFNRLNEAEQWCEKLISFDNLNEDSYLLFMQIAAKKQDNYLLKHIYQRMVNTFEKELGSSPSSELEKKYKLLLNS